MQTVTTMLAKSNLDPRAYQLVENVMASLKNTIMPITASQSANHAAVARVVLSLNLRLLENRPYLYDLDRVMHSTVVETPEGEVIARTRKFGAVMSFHLQGNLTETNPLSEETWSILAEEMALELAMERSEVERKGMVIHPFLPVMSHGVSIHPRTLQPQFDFYTSYGVSPA